MATNHQGNDTTSSKGTYASKVSGGIDRAREYRREMQKRTAIVCIDATYAKVAAGVSTLTEKLHISIVALVAGGKGRWKVVTKGEEDRDLIVNQKTLQVDGREATIVAQRPLNTLFVEAEFPIVSAAEIKACIEKHSRHPVVRMEKVMNSHFWTGLWLVWTPFVPTQRISRVKGDGFQLKIEARNAPETSKPRVEPTVQQEDDLGKNEAQEGNQPQVPPQSGQENAENISETSKESVQEVSDREEAEARHEDHVTHSEILPAADAPAYEEAATTESPRQEPSSNEPDTHSEGVAEARRMPVEVENQAPQVEVMVASPDGADKPKLDQQDTPATAGSTTVAKHAHSSNSPAVTVQVVATKTRATKKAATPRAKLRRANGNRLNDQQAPREASDLDISEDDVNPAAEKQVISKQVAQHPPNAKHN